MATQTVALPTEIETATSRIPDAPPDVRGSRDEIAEIAAIIADRFQPERIVLFGSRVYGSPRFDSDVDLMVIMDTPLETNEQRTLIREALPPALPFRPDIHMRTPKKIAIGLAEGDFFIEDVMLKGITLYRRSGAAMTDQAGASNGAEEDEQGTTLKQATQEWIEEAELDSRSAKHLLDAPDPFYETASFHAQQVAEKYLKALLQECGVHFPRTHELVDLAQPAVQAVPGIAFSGDDLTWLSEFAVAVRYPGRTANDAECRRAITIAEEVRTVVRKVLGLSDDTNGATTRQIA